MIELNSFAAINTQFVEPSTLQNVFGLTLIREQIWYISNTISFHPKKYTYLVTKLTDGVLPNQLFGHLNCRWVFHPTSFRSFGHFSLPLTIRHL